MASRDNFKKPVVEALAKRAAYICSNPDCRTLTIGPSEADPDKFIYIAEAAHIKAAAPGGPRYDPTMSSEQRSSIENALFVCSNCADLIDKNQGIDFSVEELHRWKTEHDTWVRENLNKKVSPNTNNPAIQNTVYNVTSSNQNGGITAGVVNIGPQPRKLGSQDLSRLVDAFPDKTSPITITAVMGDQEAFQYATQFKTSLEQRGYTINGVNQAMYAQPIQRVSIFLGDRSIVVGSNQ